MKRQIIFTALTACMMLGALLLVPQATSASSTITVTTTEDEFDRTGTGKGCSLREAIQAAEDDQPFGGCSKGSGDDTILLAAATYQNTREFDPYGDSGSFWIATNVTLLGSADGTTIIDGGGATIADPVFDIGIGFKVTFARLIIQNGAANQSGGGISINPKAEVTVRDSLIRNNRAENFGGGIFNQGFLRLERVVVQNNRATGPGGGVYNAKLSDYPTPTLRLYGSTISDNHSDSQGGGIFSDGTVTLMNSTVEGNYAGAHGGGIWNDGIAVLRFSTISENTAHAGGGGIESSKLLTAVNVTISGNHAGYNGGGLANYATAELYSTTIAFNTADSDRDNDGDGGGGVYSPDDSVVIRNTLIADNDNPDTLLSSHADDCKGNLQPEHYNFVETTTGCTLHITTTDNIFHRDPKLDPLADNGGRTKTHALRANSPAIDEGNPTGCVDTTGKNLVADQRGYLRTINGDDSGTARCDVGAYEYSSVALPIQTIVPLTATATRTATPSRTATPAQSNTPLPTPTLASACGSKPVGPSLVKPANDKSIPGRRVTLNWNDTLCTQRYHVRVRLDAKNGPMADEKDGLTDSMYRTIRLDKGHTYYWRVQACNSHGCKNSAWRMFTLQ